MFALRRLSPGSAAAALMLGVGLLSSIPATAQTIYRYVDAHGRITFSDRSPGSMGQARSPSPAAPSLTAPQASSVTGSTTLPYELPEALRTPVSRYPVTLLTFKECSSCDQARSYLQSRGIPFEEKTVETDADRVELFKISPDGIMPLIQVGQQRLTGFEQQEWASYLDAAGYPATSVLPAQFVQRPAVPLAPGRTTGARSAAARPAPAPDNTPSSSSPASPDNPAGIRF